MFVVSRRNIVLPGPNGEKFRMPAGYMGEAPLWAAKSAYFKALAANGKIAVSRSRKDKNIQEAEEKSAPPAQDADSETP